MQFSTGSFVCLFLLISAATVVDAFYCPNCGGGSSVSVISVPRPCYGNGCNNFNPCFGPSCGGGQRTIFIPGYSNPSCCNNNNFSCCGNNWGGFYGKK